MQKIFYPCLVFLNSLKYSRKFIVVGLLIMLPIAVTLYFLIVELNKGIVVAEKERLGLQYNGAINNVLTSLQEDRRVSYLAQSGDAAAKAQMKTVQSKIDKDMEQVDALEKQLDNLFDTSKTWTEVKGKWSDLKSKSADLNAKQSFDLHTAIISDSLALISQVGDKSNLILDPDLDSYYLMDATLIRLPALAEEISQLRELGKGIDSRKSVSKEELTMLIYKTATIKTAFDAVNYGAQVIYDKNPSLKPELIDPVQKLSTSFVKFTDELNHTYVSTNSIQGSNDGYTRSATTTVDDTHSLYERESAHLDKLLIDRSNHFKDIKYFVIGFVLAVFLIVLYVFSAFYLSIMNAIRAISGSASEVAKGNLLTRIPIHTKDEMKDAAISFNAMVDAVKQIIYSSKETADQVNATSDKIVSIADQTTKANQQMASSMQDSVKGAEMQIVATEDGSKVMNDMTIGIQRIADSTSVVSNASIESSQNALEGRRAAGKVINQMESIQDSVNQTAGTVQRLHEFSQQIDQIIGVIKVIASQTNLLALNASIEAARVGEHGRGFTVVANETRKLAEQSAVSAEDISALIQQIQETSLQSVKSMDNVINDVQIGRVVVQESSESFQQIIQSSQEIADQIQDISAASEQMAASSEEAAATISEIAQISKTSYEQFQSISETSSAQLSVMEELTEQAYVLNRMSQSLREQIGKFAI